MSDSLTAIYVEPHQCPSHQSILLTKVQSVKFSQFFFEILKNSSFFESTILSFFHRVTFTYLCSWILFQDVFFRNLGNCCICFRHLISRFQHACNPFWAHILLQYHLAAQLSFKVQQGISKWTDIIKSALRSRSTYNFIESWCLVASEGLGICVASTSFQKNYIGWPQQPPTESISDTSEKLEFWLSIIQKGAVFGHLGARDYQTIMTSRFFDEMRLLRSLRPLELLRPLRLLRLQMF